FNLQSSIFNLHSPISMPTLLIRHAEVLVTMDEQRREIRDGGLFARDGFIEQVGPTNELPLSADEVLDLCGHVVLPGLVNTHHHLYQTLTRAVPAAQNANLFGWLKTLYPIWANLTPAAIHFSTLVGLAELALSGCTTVSDHLYIFPNGCRLDDEIEAAQKIGLRFHASRGSMSLGESKGGLPPDRVVEDEAFILKDTRRLIEQYHDPKPGAMLRIAVAPCSPFSVSPDLMRESAALARTYGVRLHTHLAETLDEETFCLQKFGVRPVAYAEQLGWLGEDVWHAHAVHVNFAEIAQFARTGTGVAHCPTSNMRLASGIAPLQAYRAAGVKVGLGVDGSASNDSSHLLAEARQAMLLARLALAEEDRRLRMTNGNQPSAVGDPPSQLTAREALELATLGGAAVLGRDDIGALAPGKCADFFAVNLNRLDFAGAWHDPVAAVLFCTPAKADYTFVHGHGVVRGGFIATVEMPPVIEKHNALARKLITG
ncbi:MAG: 8-oxoguanine deaminase, partial [Anaerolineales bacterium]|nr:8-oxoguanine deaminase [Anaerolineales bacterium]